jgi:nitrite reductase/ring-hydroxylating ferredoxin subunit
MRMVAPSPPGELILDMERMVVHCPWHSWEFDLPSGRPIIQGQPGKLRVYNTSVRDGVVYVEMAKAPDPL